MWLEGNFKISRMSKDLVIKKVIAEIHKRYPSAIIHVNSYIKSDFVFKNNEEALSFFAKNVKKSKCSFLVDYKILSTKPSKIELELIDNYSKALLELGKYDAKHSIRNYKQKYKTCLQCGSTINLSLLGSNYCPVCQKDLRKEVVNQKIDELKKTVESTKKELDDFLANAEHIEVRHCYYKVYLNDENSEIYI